MTALPPLTDVLLSSPHPTSPLGKALFILFEPSPTFLQTLVEEVSSALAEYTYLPSYSHLVDKTIGLVSKWDDDLRAQFIAGHPRIGESKNLSSLSAKEQGVVAGGNSAPVTRPEVLARLAHLNACYEHVYPGLRYITFVNGRSRAEIAEEIADVLGTEHLLLAVEPPITSFEPVEVHGERWKSELDRAVIDVGRIAKSRLGALGSE